MPSPATLAPMLAKSAEGQRLRGLVWAQPKLDGVRCLAGPDGLRTRSGKRVHAPHITEALDALRAAALLPDLVFDGELYRHGWSLEAITQTARGRGVCPIGDLQFHLFDLVSPLPFSRRAAALAEILARYPVDCVVGVTSTPTTCAAGRDAHYAGCLENGYEGQMLRAEGPGYTPGRTAALLKRKPFFDAEGRVVALHYGGAERHLTGLVLATEHGEITATIPPPRLRADRAFRRPETLIGQIATYRFQPRASLNRHAILGAMHGAERL